MRPVVLSKTVQLRSSVDALWPLISDTNRINRALGLPAMRFKPNNEDQDSSARFLGETSILGRTVEFEELPFEWSYGKSIRVLRRAREGPIRSVATSCSIDADTTGAGSTLRMTLEIVPKHAVYRPLAWTVARINLRKVVALAHELDAHVTQGTPSPLAVVDSRANAERVSAAVREMKKSGVETPIADKMGAFVRDAPDFELIRMRPFDLAGTWGFGKHDVLRAMLHAVPAGLVELRWGIICPSCQTVTEETTSLAAISIEAHCQMCDISFELDLDRAVEATFTAHPSARAVSTESFCSGGPGRLPHVFSQVILEAGEAKDVDAPDAPGRYRIFARGGASASVDVATDAPTRIEASVGPSNVGPGGLRVAPRGTVRLTNATADARHVKLERLDYASDAATAHVVSTMPEFRSLFSSDLLKRSTPLKVSRAALLFSDLTGSTALYTKVGDAAAFRLVDDHFDLLRSVVSDRGGTLVKTMGDAVMAAFSDVEACAKAAIDALERFESFRASRLHGEHIGIKVGINAGPCYVVTANGALDYFGQTVNVASRVQHLAESGEIVLARDHFEALPEAERRRVRAGGEFEASVKGVAAPLNLVRLTLAPGTAPKPSR